MKIRIFKMVIIVGRNFSHRFQGTTEEEQIVVRRKIMSSV